MKDIEKFGKDFEKSPAASPAPRQPEVVRPAAEDATQYGQPLTEEERSYFMSVRNLEYLSLTAEERCRLHAIGKRVLLEYIEQPREKNGEASVTVEMAEVAEKMLYLSEDEIERWAAAEMLIVAHSRKKATRKVYRDFYAVDALYGQLPAAISDIHKSLEKLPARGSRARQLIRLLLSVLLVLLATQVVLNPDVAAIAGSLGDDNVLLLFILLLSVFMIFVIGFVGAIIFFGLFAAAAGGIVELLSPEVVGQALTVAASVIIAIRSFSKAVKENKLLKPEVVKRRADKLAQLRVEKDRCLSYGQALLRQLDAFLKEDAVRQNRRESVEQSRYNGIHGFLRSYRDKMQGALKKLERDFPGE